MELILVKEQPPHMHQFVIGYDEFGNSFHLMRDVSDCQEVKWLSSITYKPLHVKIIKWKPV